MTRETVITGMGAITPVANDREGTWKALCAGQSGVRTISRFDASGQPVRIAAEVRDFDPESFLDRKRARRSARLSQFAVAAAREALADAGLTIDGDNATRVGVVVNTAVAGMGEIAESAGLLAESGARKVSPYFVSSVIPNMAACEVAMDLGAHGPVTAGALACASGNYALLEARRLILAGEADVVIAGGTDSAITPLMFAGLTNMRALSGRNDDPAGASRPFDADRDGFVFGEGAVVHVLESAEHAKARGARPYATVAGGALTSDAFHVSAPEPSGTYAQAAIRQALRSADLDPGELDYVCAHGTSTRANDRTETRAIRGALGSHADHVPVSSPKSMVGHLIGAAGALSVLTCALAIRDGVLPPTINLHNPDPECDLDYVPNVARPARVRAAMANAFGFGGQNCVVVLRAA
ncbi:beta-ketoacyl-ACP synthase II [Amycolatopsis acidiphila]|uniref:3-oxoacyl-[acyl-carrier-protein] synthase 2 n=1 Tax=Amycolatopsis acidiphila TaxID=715473 RepID=A0A558ACA2_9PSEU|nr:beta-ketoacyl-ACP synthase II [Amycolatopsis acidiphila]TVT21894.1 beta-ketoacyl-ACP synthase II [Amycolatopsis acidiphila]UIJ57311.1 beta-ketoacyl-ACP synthase II [Amycolatopsis acidiphila]GHG84887.1 3-oxoacyl-[acyl-carrier-protein] synthase 2 [Amycolatopsis acidiphila]